MFSFHHSGIVVASEQYKYLVQGEYVSFTLRDSDNDDHPYQAGEVRGVCNGWLMCETRNAARASRDSEEGDGEDDSSSRRAPRRRQTTGRRNVKPRGSGPREGKRRVGPYSSHYARRKEFLVQLPVTNKKKFNK